MAACLAALFQVALVVFFRAPEGLRGLNPGYNALRLEAAFGGELFDLCLGLLLLFRGVEEDGGAILRAPVRALAVEGRGVVQGKEGVQKLLVADLRGVEVELDHLGMACSVSAYIFVVGPLQLAALIADGGCGYAGDGGEGGFHAPETSGSESCFFCAHE